MPVERAAGRRQQCWAWVPGSLEQLPRSQSSAQPAGKPCVGSKRRAVSWVLKDEPKFSRRTMVLGEFRQKEEPRDPEV